MITANVRGNKKTAAAAARKERRVYSDVTQPLILSHFFWFSLFLTVIVFLWNMCVYIYIQYATFIVTVTCRTPSSQSKQNVIFYIFYLIFELYCITYLLWQHQRMLNVPIKLFSVELK